MKGSFWDIFKFDWKWKTYMVWVINTDVKCELYLWDNWSKLLPSIDQLVALTEQPAFIRTSQAYQHEHKWLGFGRMKWSKENNIKWTTKHRTNNPSEPQPEFYDTQIWAPDWNKVYDTSIPPDVFIHLYHYKDFHPIQEGLTIAIPNPLYIKNKMLVDGALNDLVGQISGASIHQINRQWWGGTFGPLNNIEDMNPHEVRKIVTGQ